MKVLVIIAMAISIFASLMILLASGVSLATEQNMVERKKDSRIFFLFFLLSAYISTILICIVAGGYLNV